MAAAGLFAVLGIAAAVALMSWTSDSGSPSSAGALGQQSGGVGGLGTPGLTTDGGSLSTGAAGVPPVGSLTSGLPAIPGQGPSSSSSSTTAS